MMHNTRRTLVGTAQGFTLLELVVVLGIISLIAGAGLSMATGALKAADRVTTQERLNTIKLALDSYGKTYGYLPCPAPRNVGATDATFGLESRSGANCTSGTGVVNVGGGTGVWFGALPVRTLGLPDNYASDAWGGKLAYAVSASMIIGPASYSTLQGAIEIRSGNLTTFNTISTNNASGTYTNANSGGNANVTLTPFPGANTLVILRSNAGSAGYNGSYFVKGAANPTLLTTNSPGTTTYLAHNASDAGGTVTYKAAGPGAAYAVVSHGPNGLGAFSANGSSIPANKTCTGSGIDVENCDDDAIFFDSDYNDGTQASVFFDDYIVYGSNDIALAPLNNSLYTSSTTTTCPAGTCEAWCAACTANYPGGGAVAPPAILTSPRLCRKVITSNASICTASCFWSGVTAGGLVECP